MMAHRPALHRTLIALSLAAIGGNAHASGFQLMEQNASGMGNAYAGSAAKAENASVMYYNPAAMNQLKGTNISGGVVIVRPSIRFTGKAGSTTPAGVGMPNLAPDLGGQALPAGSSGGNAGSLAAVPNTFITKKINDRLTAGVGISVPFGLSSKYKNDWIGQYQSRKFGVKSVNVNPAISWKVNDIIALGLGFNWQYVQATYTKKMAVNLHNTPSPMTSAYTTADGKLMLRNNGFGWNAGVLVTPTERTAIGLSYRSEIKHHTKGRTDVTNIAGAGTVLPGTTIRLPGSVAYASRAEIDLPETYILSVAHQLNDKVTLLGDISRTNWSSMQDFLVTLEDGQHNLLPLKFRDTWRVAVGADWQVQPKVKLKFGVAYDQSPVKGLPWRGVAMPDNDRRSIATGVQYQYSPYTTIDVGYSHFFVRKTPIDTNVPPTYDPTYPYVYGRMVGDYDSSANLLGVQVSSQF